MAYHNHSELFEIIKVSSCAAAYFVAQFLAFSFIFSDFKWVSKSGVFATVGRAAYLILPFLLMWCVSESRLPGELVVSVLAIIVMGLVAVYVMTWIACKVFGVKPN